MRFLSLLLVASFLVAAGCSSSPAPEFVFPEAEAAGIDGERLGAAYRRAHRIANMKSLLVWRNGRIVAEHYFHGTKVDDTHDVRSVTKSVLSALVGIAAERGIVHLDDSMAEHLGPVVGTVAPAARSTTLRHLLTMTAGHRWRELGGRSEFGSWVSARDQIRYVLEKPLVDPPGARFCYSDGSAHLVSAVLSTATGMTTAAFAHQVLFEPLGIGRRSWKTDKQGYNYGGVGLSLTPRDMVKIGVLYLRHGEHDGEQVVPASWVDASTRALVSTDRVIPLGSSYGYFWWVGRSNAHDLYFATGYGGQFIVNVPDLDLVVVATSRWRNQLYSADQQWSEVLQVIVGGVIPAVETEQGGISG